jgi:cytochrome c oxidase assembly protein subunit 15
LKARVILLLLTVVLVFSLIVVGAYVTAGGYGAACGTNLGSDWPLCNGNLLPPPQIGPVAEYSHRILASLSTLFLFVTTFLFWRGKDSPGSVRKLLYLASVLIVVEIVLGGAVVTQELEAALVTVHQADALLIFGLTAAAGALALSGS